MPFSPAAGTVRATLEFVWRGQIVAITISVRKPTGFDATDYDTLSAELLDWYQDAYKAYVSTQCALQKINILDLSSAIAPSIEYPISPNIPGGNIGGATALNATLVTSFKTDQRGRSYRGRNYFVGLPAPSMVDSGSVSSGVAAGITLVYAALAVRLASISMEHVVVSRQQNGVIMPVAVVTPVTEYFTETNIDSQRRRLVGRGI